MQIVIGATYFNLATLLTVMPSSIVIPLITPHKKGELDLEALDSLLGYAESNGFDGVFAASSTGGVASLSYGKHLEFMQEVMNRSKKLRLFANISRNDLEESLDMMKASENLGYENLVVINPYYHQYSQESMRRYFSEIASRTSSNIYIYNNPSLTGLTVSPVVVEALVSEYSAVKGIKDSGGDLDRFDEFLKIHGLEVYQGKDHLLDKSLKMGAYGGVCSTSNFSLNTLHVAHDSGDVSHFAEKINRVTAIMKKHEVPAFHNYMFRRFVMGQKNPVDYMNRPFSDLPSPPDDSELSDVI